MCLNSCKTLNQLNKHRYILIQTNNKKRGKEHMYTQYVRVNTQANELNTRTHIHTCIWSRVVMGRFTVLNLF